MFRSIFIVSSLVVVGCASDPKGAEDGAIGDKGDPPVVWIQAPTDGEHLQPGELTAIEATLSHTRHGDLGCRDEIS